MTDLERAIAAAMANIRQQLGGKSMNHPGGEGFAWHAEGGSFDMGLAIRAALLALREPSEAMKKAMTAEMAEVDNIVVLHAARTGRQLAYKDGIAPLWRAWAAAIDSILSPASQGATTETERE